MVGALIPNIKQEILIVADEGREEEVITRMARVGYDYTIGYLKGGMKAWQDAGFEVDTIKTISVEELADLRQMGILIFLMYAKKVNTTANTYWMLKMPPLII